jgi:hypothetical protein
VLQLTPASEASFPDDAALIVREAAPLLQVFLAGAVRRESAIQVNVPSAFIERIGEELARAKRFDLGLSMLLVDLNAGARSHDAMGDVIASIRAELRESDIIGVLDRGRIAALLVHTDIDGVTTVVQRIRRRLGEVLSAAGSGELRVGRAVLSSECQTTAELLARASRDVEAVVPTL